MTRAEIQDPRTEPADLLIQYKTLGSIYCYLAAMLLQAYRANKTIYFQNQLRLLREDLEAEFPRAPDFPVSDEPNRVAQTLRDMLKVASGRKGRS